MEGQQFGLGFVDFDQDGALDLFVGTGDVFKPLEGDPSYLYFNDGGGDFELHTPADGDAVATPTTTRGVSFGDLDGDGVRDLVTLAGRRVPVVSVHDGEAGLLDNIGSVIGVRQETLACRKFSKCGRPDQVYAYQEIDAEGTLIKRAR